MPGPRRPPLLLSGKWHLASDMDHPNPAWPTRRGCERSYRTLLRDEEDIADEAAAPGFSDATSGAARDFVTEHHESTPDRPYFLYLAYTAPHWPLHAPEEGLLDERWRLTPRDARVPEWDGVGDQEWEVRRMEVYAAQVSRMDEGVCT